LKSLELRFKPDHPDIGLLKRRIRDLERKADAEALAAPVSNDGRPTTAAEAARYQRVTGLRQELELLDRQIAQKQAEEKRLREVSGTYQARVDAAPARETELIELSRDYEGIQKMYDTLLAKKEESKIAANLERRQIGEQFKLLDPARMPERPFSPDRQLINFAGMGIGLAIGFALVALLEFRDSSFKLEHEVTSVLALPVLAVVPLMQSDVERRRVLWRRVILHGTMCGVVLGCMGILAYTFLR
jgi:uncharacterized protein involved in exopolysaccharide biosynthesis